MLVFNVPPTAKVIWKRGNGLKSHPTDWRSRESILPPLVYKASGLSTTPQTYSVHTVDFMTQKCSSLSDKHHKIHQHITKQTSSYNYIEHETKFFYHSCPAYLDLLTWATSVKPDWMVPEPSDQGQYILQTSGKLICSNFMKKICYNIQIFMVKTEF